MSKLKMLKFEAATLQKNSKGFIEQLQRLGACEISNFDDKRLFNTGSLDAVASYEKSISAINEAMTVLSELGIKTGVGMFSGRSELTDEQYNEMSQSVSEYISIAHEINRLNKSISDNKAELVRLNTAVDSLTVWQNLDIPLSVTKTDSSNVFIGTLPKPYTYDELAVLFSQNLGDIREYSFEIVYSSKDVTALVVMCHRSVEKQVFAFLRTLSFIAPQDTSLSDVSQRLEKLSSDVKACEDRIAKANEKIKAFGEDVDKLKFAYDFCNVKCDEYKTLSNVKFSDKTIYIRGYIPEIAKDELGKLVKKHDGAVVFSEPSEDDEVPVALSNGKFSEPVESIVEMYATPGKNDIDPSKVMAFFYYLLFGMMLSDAGYGVVMTIGTAIILRKTGVEGGMRKMLKMFFYCGISTTVWGALFGSWFGDIVPVVAKHFFGIEKMPSVALWFEPLSDPIKLLLFSFVIGIAHLFLGLFVLMYMKWKEGDKVGAICDTVPIMLTVLGAAPLAGGILADMPAGISSIAKYVLISGVVLIVLTNSRSSKNIIARLGGGLYGLYNIASGYLSDILSYSRLLALGLATGSIASVVNMLGVMPQGMVMKTVTFIVVFFVGHTLNMAINVLGAYVHTNRLQFVELFSKFYEGGGKAYSPFKLNTKFFKLKEENKND